MAMGSATFHAVFTTEEDGEQWEVKGQYEMDNPAVIDFL